MSDNSKERDDSFWMHSHDYSYVVYDELLHIP